jgi:hypothetical protein
MELGLWQVLNVRRCAMLCYQTVGSVGVQPYRAVCNRNVTPLDMEQRSSMTSVRKRKYLWDDCGQKLGGLWSVTQTSLNSSPWL